MITDPIYYKTREDGIVLVERHSDQGMLCREVGTERLYSQIIDPQGSDREYEETDIPIADEEEATMDDALGCLNELGVETDDQ